jgi:hypothetical protein
MAVYAGASTTVAILSGPIGWTIAAVAILGGLAYFALANVDRTAAFVMTMNVIKATRWQAEGQKDQGAEPSGVDSGSSR